MYKTVVFDLDGTLLDTLDDLADAVNFALTEFSLPTRTREEVRAFIGNGMANLMERAVGYADHPQAEDILWAFKKYYAAHCKDKTRPYDGIVEVLQTLKAQGKKLAVLSNKADFAVKALVEEYFPQTFDAVQGENEAAGIRKKPAPDALFTIMETLGCDRKNTLYIGDSEVDIHTAKNADVTCLSVTWGFKDRAFLIENGGKIFADSPEEIVALCKE